MAEFLQSNKVRVFPTAYRKETTSGNTTTVSNPESHLNTEFNLSTISRRLTDKDAFIISYDDKGAEDVMTISIHGYWFELKGIASQRTDGESLWANIMVRDIAGTYKSNLISLPTLYSFKETSTTALDNLDDSAGEFGGLKLSSTEITPTGTEEIHSLQLFDARGNIPKESWLRTGTHSVFNTENGEDTPISDEFFTGTVTANTIDAVSVNADDATLGTVDITRDLHVGGNASINHIISPLANISSAFLNEVTMAPSSSTPGITTKLIPGGHILMGKDSDIGSITSVLGLQTPSIITVTSATTAEADYSVGKGQRGVSFVNPDTAFGTTIDFRGITPTTYRKVKIEHNTADDKIEFTFLN